MTENEKPKTFCKNSIFLIINGAIGAIIMIIYLIFFTQHEVTIQLRDNIERETKISGIIRFSNQKNYEISKYEALTIKLTRGDHKVRAESKNYMPKDEIINSSASPAIIYMTARDMTAQDPSLANRLSMPGWNIWGGIITITKGNEINECVINSKGRISDAAGFFYSDLGFLRNKTLILYFSNTKQSKFLDNRLVKLEYCLVLKKVYSLMLKSCYKFTKHY